MGLAIGKGSSAAENVVVIAGGRSYDEWESVTVVHALNQGACTFELHTTEVITQNESPFDKWNFPPNTVVVIYAGGDILMNGVVDLYEPQGDAEAHSVICSGRTNARDFIDSSPRVTQQWWSGVSVMTVLQALAAPTGIAIIDETGGLASSAMIPLDEPFQIRRGMSTNWAEAQRLVELYGFTLHGLPEGGIAVSRAGTTVHAGGIVQGFYRGFIPIGPMSARLSSDERFNTYSVIGQSALGTSYDDDLGPEGTAIDGTAPPTRFREIQTAENADKQRLTQLAEWERARAAGASMQATLTVPSWRDVAGALWRANQLVYVHSQWLKISQSMLIESVEFTQDNEAGTTATLTIVDPRAYLGQPPAGGGGGGGGVTPWPWF